ncbi:MBL fold metallo-hydrolase [Holospora curviuscula]|uniref:Phosphoribosyl 1,2-cyclic phosphodiesterase n=1 Tax=Holospora curviuscula TaxID=1082868 RepID=A0A2S5R8X6_9PROT|nr:MBL fold metallo-hydrolase [Holospora curviuscula]PPE03750.1 Phosphoribosyl 1,2-cyclic phosphodiesterase [Holospora curviuscula]
MQGIVLGCGPSVGVPSLRWGWGACDPKNPKNQRTRSSFFFRTLQGSWLIDASPDLRYQCLAQGVKKINGVLCTHAHMDHIGGVGDLVAFAVSGPVLFYADSLTCEALKTMLPYAFLGNTQFIQLHPIQGLFYLFDIPVVSFIQNHGTSYSLGYRFPTWAYSTDLVELSEEAFDLLKGIDTWILACLSTLPNKKHAHLERVLTWVERVKPKRTILTHMNSDLDYNTLKDQLPFGVEPGFDGMVLSL